MRRPHPRLLHSHWEDAPADLQLHVLLMGSARTCGFCSTTIHHFGHMWKEVSAGHSSGEKMNFPGKKESTENDSKTTLSWQEGLHM